MITELLQGLRATSPLEAASVFLGLVYVVLAVRRERLCWVMGGLSSAILVLLYARSQLPLQALLQAYYVAMSGYGFLSWARTSGQSLTVGTLPLRVHLLAATVIAVGAALTARLLAAELHDAWPYLDSLTTWASLYTTWLAARMKLENWVYWIVIDLATVVLSAAQGLTSVALLFLAYAVIAAIGYFSWLRAYRAPPAAAVNGT
jgi:nicotinamide mononucleotide transporter